MNRADLRKLKEASVCGALHLDHRMPGWAAGIDPVVLDMGRGDRCVGAHVNADGGGEDAGCYEWFVVDLIGPIELGTDDAEWQEKWTQQHGFWALHPAAVFPIPPEVRALEEREFDVLTRFWRRLVTARQGA